MHSLARYFLIAAIIAFIVCLISAPFCLWFRHRKHSTLSILVKLAFIVSIALILYATLFFTGWDFTVERTLNLQVLDWIHMPNARYFAVEKIANVLLFMPFGFLLPLIYRSRFPLFNVLIVSSAFSIGVETIQYFIGRCADADDVLCNVLGALAGYLIYRLAKGFYSLFFRKKESRTGTSGWMDGSQIDLHY